MLERLIDLIYEAAAQPSLWPVVLQQISDLVGGVGGVFIVPAAGAWLASPKLVDMVSDFTAEGWATNNERTRRLLAAKHPGFVTDVDVFKPEEIPKDPVYRDFFLPRGYGWGVATVVEIPSGDAAVIHVEREFTTGPVERKFVDMLDGLRPHLARAALLTCRLNLEKAQATAATLQMLGLPGAVLDSSGRIVAANERLSQLIPRIIQDRQSRVSLVDGNADALLAQAIRHMTGVARPVSSIPIPAREDMPAYIVHVAPVKGEAQDVFGAATTMLVVTPVEPREVPTANVLQGLFDLTPIEAKVAKLIGDGKTLSTVARRLNLSEEGMRRQMKSVFAKTGLNRQTELIRLLRDVF